jgi:hypothetical protein
MAKTSSSKKAKGCRLEKEIAKLYARKLFPRATRMPMSGAMQYHKGDIFKGVYDEWVDECKNQEKVKLWEWWQQAKDQCGHYQKPLLHISRNYSENLTVMRTDDYFELRETIADLQQTISELEKIKEEK